MNRKRGFGFFSLIFSLLIIFLLIFVAKKQFYSSSSASGAAYNAALKLKVLLSQYKGEARILKHIEMQFDTAGLTVCSPSQMNVTGDYSSEGELECRKVADYGPNITLLSGPQNHIVIKNDGKFYEVMSDTPSSFNIILKSTDGDTAKIVIGENGSINIVATTSKSDR